MRQLYIALLLFTVCTAVNAQDQTIPYSKIDLTKLDGFRPAGTNWKIVADVFYDPLPGGKESMRQGAGVLVNDLSEKEKSHLFTTMEHGDIEIELEFMMEKNSNSGIYFQGRYEVQLYDSWGVQNPKSLDCGAIYERWDERRPEGRKGYEGHPPSQNVSKAPGLWQHYKIHFRAPKFDQQGKKTENARFVKVIHNGVSIHENVEVTGPTRAAFFEDERPVGPLMFQGDHGRVAIRNIRYKAYGAETVTLSDLKIAAYEGKFNSFPDLASLTPVKQTAISTLEHSGTESNDNFAGKITGTMHIPKTGSYLFHLNLKWIPTDINPDRPNGGGEFTIGNKKIFHIDGSKSGHSTTIEELEAGDYPIALTYYKSHKLWFVPTDDIVLAVEAPGIAYSNLNPAFKAVDAVGAISVPVHQKPVMLRSFMNHNGVKKTHALSVGEPGRINYTIDLSTGAFLQFWRGNFAETTLMWHGRGEPQLAEPLGSVITLSGRPSISILKDRNEIWPDSITDFNFSGYDVDVTGRPIIKYSVGEIQVRDSFEASPDGKRLKHSIALKQESGVKQVYCLVAEASEILKMPNGMFSIDKRYFIELSEKQDVVLRKTSGNTTELLLPVKMKNDTGSITYSIVW